jgi:hypothetical protein
VINKEVGRLNMEAGEEEPDLLVIETGRSGSQIRGQGLFSPFKK